MKYLIILGDGMADEPIKALDNKTPLEYAKTKAMDTLSTKSSIGMVKTIPEGMEPGSDTANLSVLGYDPREYYTGRSPLEALSIGVDMKETDVAIRCNLVTISEDESEYENKKIIDHSSSEISTEEAEKLINEVKKYFQDDKYSFYSGTSYRHLTIWDKGEVIPLTPPHDILGNVIDKYLPEDDTLKEMMIKSFEILNNHPINIERAKKGLNKANSIWFWGAGTKPCLSSFEERYSKKGAMISAVDLLKGIAVGAKMHNINIKGANGTLHTNYQGKASEAVKALVDDNYDFVYVHVEAPDEMGHQGSVENKVKAIEYLDEKIILPITSELDKKNVDYRMLILPDHPTPVRLRTHTDNPVPFMLYDSTDILNKKWKYNERECEESKNVIKDGHTLIKHLFSKS